MRRKRIDNFKIWRDRQKAEGKIKSSYNHFEKNAHLAELIGVVLGDGHIGKFPRCDCLRIIGNSGNQGFVKRYADLVKAIFGKQPTILKVKNANANSITIYEKHISKRLGIPSGSRAHFNYKLPSWIKNNRKNTLGFLRGLYEAEGCVCHHEQTYTHKIIFANRNKSLLEIVMRLVSGLGFAPHYSAYKVQISRKRDVQKFTDLIRFRSY